MRGCLFTLLLGAIVVGFVVVVGLPAAAAGILTAGLSAAGLVADDTTVTVTSDPPTDLLGLRADRVRVTATDATFRGMEIGALDLALGDVADPGADGRERGRRADRRHADRTPAASGSPSSGSRSWAARTGSRRRPSSPAREAEALIADAVEAQTGRRPTSVTLRAPDRVSFVLGGTTVAGQLGVTPDGDLVVRGDDGLTQGREVVLVRGGEDLPIELTSVRVTGAGDLRLTGDLAVGILG